MCQMHNYASFFPSLFGPGHPFFYFGQIWCWETFSMHIYLQVVWPSYANATTADRINLLNKQKRNKNRTKLLHTNLVRMKCCFFMSSFNLYWKIGRAMFRSLKFRSRIIIAACKWYYIKRSNTKCSDKLRTKVHADRLVYILSLLFRSIQCNLPMAHAQSIKRPNRFRISLFYLLESI